MSPRRKPVVPAADPSAGPRFARLLRLLPVLADGRTYRLHEVADRVHGTVEEVRQDLQALQDRAEDGPGGFIEGIRLVLERTSVSLQSSFFVRPMKLSHDEWAALDLGVALLTLEEPDLAGLAPDARKKLRTLRADGSHATGRGGRVPGGAPSRAVAAREARHLGALQRAWGTRTVVSLRYAKPGGEAVAREVHPYRLVYATGVWYLVAYDPAARLPKVYRLDRVSGVRLLSSRYEIPASFDLEQVVKDRRVFVAAEAGVLVVRYSARIARWVVEQERAAPQPDGSVVVTYPLADDGWAVRHVLQYAGDALVLEPARVREQVIRALRTMRGR